MPADNERDELAQLIDPNALELDAYQWPRDAADRILSSSWLAGNLKKARAEALEEAARMVSAYTPALIDGDGLIVVPRNRIIREIRTLVSAPTAPSGSAETAAKRETEDPT